jgi:hypothetical protein
LLGFITPPSWDGKALHPASQNQFSTPVAKFAAESRLKKGTGSVSPLVICLIAFACIFGGILLGMFIRAFLPEHHLSGESKDALKLGIGMTATLAALVIALLLSSAKSSYDTGNIELMQAGSRFILLDGIMAQYGPETNEARELLRRTVAAVIERRWPEEGIAPAVAEAPGGRAGIDAVQAKLLQLSPLNDAQRALKSRALQINDAISEGRWLIIEQRGQSSLPMPFFVVLVFWLTIIFATFSLVSPRNGTVIAVLLVCAFSAAGSLFLILELDNPYAGLLKISSAPLRNALTHLSGTATGMLK